MQFCSKEKEQDEKDKNKIVKCKMAQLCRLCFGTIVNSFTMDFQPGNYRYGKQNHGNHRNGDFVLESNNSPQIWTCQNDQHKTAFQN